MTLPVTDEMPVRAIKDGPPYKVGPHCANPNCESYAQDAHHMQPRSAIGGDYRWIEIDGRIVGNLTGVCRACHIDLTGDIGGHKAAIRYHQGLFWWALVTESEDVSEPSYYLVDPIRRQPPTPDQLEGEQHEPPQHCPFCGQKRRRPAPTTGRPFGRRRKTWTVKVPAEDEEDGAEVLDTLVENLALVIPNADASASGRYYVLVPVLAYATMEVDRFLQTMEGTGG